MMYWRYGPQASPPADGSYYWYSHPMMGWVGQNNAAWVFGIFWVITWLLVIAVLFALLRWLWKKGDSETKRR